MKLPEYYDLLAGLDWTYMMSDAHNICSQGRQEMANARRLSQESPEHQKLFSLWYDYSYSGQGWGGEQKPKPEKPKI